MKKWYYSTSSNSIWASFDCGEVEAETYEEAEKKALAELNKDFAEANRALELADTGFSISFDKRGVELEEVK